MACRVKESWSGTARWSRLNGQGGEEKPTLQGAPGDQGAPGIPGGKVRRAARGPRDAANGPNQPPRRPNSLRWESFANQSRQAVAPIGASA